MVREEQGSVAMEDVVIQRTTVRSTKENPSSRKGSTVFIQGDNINIGTLIVNSPNAHVDNSVNTVTNNNNFHIQQNKSFSTRSTQTGVVESDHVGETGLYYPSGIPKPKHQEPTDIDRDFFKRIKPEKFASLIPSFIMMIK